MACYLLKKKADPKKPDRDLDDMFSFWNEWEKNSNKKNRRVRCFFNFGCCLPNLFTNFLKRLSVGFFVGGVVMSGFMKLNW